jgi:hypothetical protein
MSLSEMQIVQKPFEEDNKYSNLTIENQIVGFIHFLKMVNQGLSQQKKPESHLLIERSYKIDVNSTIGRTSKKYWNPNPQQ